MLAIRLFRTGKKNQPFFRVVVTDKRNPPSAGRTVEILGFFNPLTKERKLDAERAKYWLSVGAQPSDTAYNLLVSEKVIEGKKISSHKKSKKPVEEVAAEPVAEKPAEPVPAAAEAPESKPAVEETPTKKEENPVLKEEEKQPAPVEPMVEESKKE